MEQPITAFFDEEWESLTKMFSTEDADFMLQQLHGSELFSASAGGCDAAGLFFQAPASFWPVNQGGSMEDVAGVGDSFHCYDDQYYTNFQNVSQESSHSSGSENNSVVFSNLANDINIFQVLNACSESIDFSAMDEKNSDNTSVVPVIPIAEDQTANIADPKRKFARAEQQTEAEENPKKKARVSRNAQKNKRNVQPKPKKNQKAAGKEDEETNANTNTLQNGQSSCSYSSEDDSNASQESNGGEASDNKEAAALNLNGKTRASRGSATDPQSLYARRRRERINERLRILQNLIPNGTKVDISTMLEEAVHYVKFLQLQIKLLSSDDMWMYAPIVYNGLDIGLYGRIFSTQ